MRSLTRRFVAVVVISLALPLALEGCHPSAKPSKTAVEALREQAANSSDVLTLERWFAAELLEPKGRGSEAAKARKRIEELGGPKSTRGELAFALDDHFHGRLKAATNRYLKAAVKARLDNTDRESDALGWAAVHYALELKRNDPDFYAHWKEWIDKAVWEPLALGWRARAELTDYWLSELDRDGVRPGELSRLERSAEQFGCAKNLRIAGPFGHGAGRDLQRSFPAEKPGPWPLRWDPEPGIDQSPAQLKTERNGCLVEATDPPGEGIYYAETFLELKEPRDLIIAFQGARSVFVDDYPVLERDTRTFGIWPKFGVRVRLQAGRHRLLARLNSAQSSIRIVEPQGRPGRIETSTDGSAPYSIHPPEIVGDPNVVSRYVHGGNVRIPTDPILRFAVASLAEEEGQSDVASLILEPDVAKPDEATGIALLLAARFTEQDPLFAEGQSRDLIHALHEKAKIRDPELWEPALASLLFQAEQSGPQEVIKPLEALAKAHPEVPGIIGSLVRLYRQLGWTVLYQQSVERMLLAFPKDPDALANAIELDDSRGKWPESEALVKQLLELDGDNEIALRRALAREDYPTALAELKRLGERRPERKDIAERTKDVLERSGDLKEGFERLAALLVKNARDTGARHSMADYEYAHGRRDALRHAIVDAIEADGNTDSLQEALDLVEGMTELEPFRLKSDAVIKAFESSGRALPGTAARVLDYAATWIHADGTSRMLEHEIVRIQSAEAIRDFAEYQPPQGLLLHLRVIKPDGRTLEPQPIPSKPTVTFPHLEVGDYIETEVVVRYEGDGQHGKTYLGHTWFFREEKLAYDRSEFVVISPERRPLTIEARGGAPKPVVEKRDGLVIHRFRVDSSPAAPSEPYRPSARETLPNVRLGWGADPMYRLREFMDATAILTPMDPRIVRIAKRIVDGATDKPEQAKRLYHYVMNNVEEGEENDGRQIIMGRRGNRWRGFIELCRALEIPYAFGIAKNQLAPPPAGPFDAMFEYSELFLRLGDANHPLDLTIGEKFTPFGYLPAEIRGAQGYLLDGESPKAVTLTQGSTVDTFNTVIRGRLRADGAATLDVEQTLTGKPAIMLRNIVASAPQAQLKSFVESRLIAPALQGARLIDFDFVQSDKSDEALVMKSRVEVPRLADRVNHGLTLGVPFTPRIGALGSLASRETPMVLDDSSDQRQLFELELPEGATVPNLHGNREFKHENLRVTFKDRLEKGKLVLERRTVLPAGRIAVEKYEQFATFAREAGGALGAEIRIVLPH
jgi:tetratricopeptide (TPR) repeat protein